MLDAVNANSNRVLSREETRFLLVEYLHLSLMYTILSTFPPHSSGNVGDKLLEEQVQHLIQKERGVGDFNVVFREHDFSATLDQLNASDAIILPAFAIREPLYPQVYRLAENIDEIQPPIIPLASNWSHYPGDQLGNETHEYQTETLQFLQRLANQPELDGFTTRDIYTKRILERHGFEARLVGDLGWYHDDYLGHEMRVPDSIDHIVMTTPHNAHYVDQAEGVMDMLIERYPDATLTCSFHSRLTDSDRQLRELAKDRGFKVVLASHDTKNIEFYNDCDLHVGYRLHGHISFLRRRLPSVLIGEDGRGNGFNATLGTAGFPATQRRLGPRTAKLVQSFAGALPGKGLRKFIQHRGLSERPFHTLIAPPDPKVPEKINAFLQEEQTNGFKSYKAVPELFDETYENSMKPFLKKLP
ncbi:hypothetical protein GJ631_00690 [Natronomonas sp. CBA1123]|uniref:polysaccharide pyruvyl transferase family protein n=1 Tax=Natronomonas sp. CBA1123 TaxID=2668070 RepID=UPI0012E9EA6D|nr:hypothetical protein [Natronomonas sp. CBA1123]